MRKKLQEENSLRKTLKGKRKEERGHHWRKFKNLSFRIGKLKIPKKLLLFIWFGNDLLHKHSKTLWKHRFLHFLQGFPLSSKRKTPGGKLLEENSWRKEKRGKRKSFEEIQKPRFSYWKT